MLLASPIILSSLSHGQVRIFSIEVFHILIECLRGEDRSLGSGKMLFKC